MTEYTFSQIDDLDSQTNTASIRTSHSVSNEHVHVHDVSDPSTTEDELNLDSSATADLRLLDMIELQKKILSNSNDNENHNSDTLNNS